MKCTVCGNELKEGAKFCKSCGSPVKIGPKIMPESGKTCPKCGADVDTKKRFCKFCGWDTSMPYVMPAAPEPQSEPPRKSSKGIVLKVILVILILGILGAGGFFGYKFFINKSESESASVSTEEKSAENTEDNGDGGIAVNGEESTTAAKDDDTTAASEATTEAADANDSKSLGVNYVNNTSCDIDSNLTVDDFERVVSKDGEYYFSYPKYLFNNFSYSDDGGYYFSYEDGGETVCYMKVYSEDAQTDDPVTFMAQKQKELMNRFPNTDFSQNGTAGHGYYYPEDCAEKGIGDDEFMQVVISAWTTSSRDFRTYINAANDGKKTYYIEFGYPDYEPDYDYEKWDYVVDSVYRLGSFTGWKTPVAESYDAYLERNNQK